MSAKVQGTVKWFNVTKGFGFITRADNQQDVFVHQSVIQSPGFRSLNDGEVVEFEVVTTEKGTEAANVTGVNGGQVVGSRRRRARREGDAEGEGAAAPEKAAGEPRSRGPAGAGGDRARPNRRRPQSRCYNCGENGHLARECTQAAQPKRCHNCQSTDHLVANCPQQKTEGQ